MTCFNCLPLLEKHFTKFHEEVGNEMKRFLKFSYPYYGVREAEKLQNSSLVNQFGEGWLIAAEIVVCRNGINDVLCLQPLDV